MHGEREERGLRGAPTQMNFPALLISSGTHTHTPTHAHTHLIFLHPLKSSNISFTASCFSQIPLSTKSAVVFEDKCDQSRGGGGVLKRKKKKKNLAWGHLGFRGGVWSRGGSLTSAAFGDSFDVPGRGCSSHAVFFA